MVVWMILGKKVEILRRKLSWIDLLVVRNHLQNHENTLLGLLRVLVRIYDVICAYPPREPL